MSDSPDIDDTTESQRSVRLVRISIMDTPAEIQDRYVATFEVSDGWVGAVLAPFDELPENQAEIESHEDQFGSSSEAIKWALSKVIDLDWDKQIDSERETEGH